MALANVGNEGHSYLHHMATRHDSLAPLTLFLPDTVWNDATLSKPHFMHDVVVRAPKRPPWQLTDRGLMTPCQCLLPLTRRR